jgi:hypothetical protein
VIGFPIGHIESALGAFDSHYTGSEIAEDHGRVRPGADSGEFEDLETVEWTRHWLATSHDVWASSRATAPRVTITR